MQVKQEVSNLYYERCSKINLYPMLVHLTFNRPNRVDIWLKSKNLSSEVYQLMVPVK